ncbi:MAG: efflux RND transporter periplasmic adaptor subunit [Pseudomonadota bacterium]
MPQPNGNFSRLFKAIPVGYLQIAGIVCLCAVAFFYAQAPTQAEVIEQRALELGPRPEQDKPLVRVVNPNPADHAVRVRTTGSAVVRNGIELVPQVSGRVVWVDPMLRRGGRFAAQEPLLRIDPEDFELALAQAEADVLAAESNLQLTTANSEAAIANYALLHGDKPVPALVAKKPQLEQAKAQIAAAAARLDIARLNLTRTTFSLPFAGRVVDSKAEIGQMLNAGMVFGEVFANDAVEVVVPLSTTQLGLIQPAVGRKATIEVDGRLVEGKVVRVSADLDARTRFAQVFLAVDSSDTQADVRPGAFVDVEIEGPQIAGSLLLPEAAEQANQSVWTVVDGVLTEARPRFVNRSEAGILAEGFVTGSGVVVGTVPGAYEGLAVTTTPAS